MHVLYAAGLSLRQDGPVRLIQLNAVWHVVARGYLCRVADVHEGRLVIALLQAPPPSQTSPDASGEAGSERPLR